MSKSLTSVVLAVCLRSCWGGQSFQHDSIEHNMWENSWFDFVIQGCIANCDAIKMWKSESEYFPRCTGIILYRLHRARKKQKQSIITSLLYMETEQRKKRWATHHVQQHYHEASPGSTGCQLGRTSCEVTTVPALPRGMAPLCSVTVWEKEGMNRDTIMRKTGIFKLFASAWACSVTTLYIDCWFCFYCLHCLLLYYVWWLNK